jgi:sensor domain CHASE-containing protein
MSLDGLRAWIGMVERKLTMRTRVFLVLVAIAVGGAAAAVYLSIDAQNNQVSESDLQTLQTELTTRIEALETKSASLEAEVRAK